VDIPEKLGDFGFDLGWELVDGKNIEELRTFGDLLEEDGNQFKPLDLRSSPRWSQKTHRGSFYS